MVLYLFCNDNYGAAYARAAARLSREQKLDVRVVLSGKRRRSEPDRGPFDVLLRPWNGLRRRRAVAMRLGLRVLVVLDVNSQRFLDRIAPGDHAVIAGFNQIFRQSAIARFQSFVNFHPSLLPCYRGPLPSYWCLKHRETHTGYTLHRVTAEIDRGEILHQEVVPIGDAKHPRELDRRIAERGARCLERWVEHLATGDPWCAAERIDVRSVYRKPLDYAPYPDFPARALSRTKP